MGRGGPPGAMGLGDEGAPSAMMGRGVAPAGRGAGDPRGAMMGHGGPPGAMGLVDVGAPGAMMGRNGAPAGQGAGETRSAPIAPGGGGVPSTMSHHGDGVLAGDDALFGDITDLLGGSMTAGTRATYPTRADVPTSSIPC